MAKNIGIGGSEWWMRKRERLGEDYLTGEGEFRQSDVYSCLRHLLPQP